MSDERKKQNWRVAPSRSAVPTPNPGMDYWWNRWIDSEEPVPVSQMRQPQAMTAVCYALDFAQWFAERCAEFGRDYTASAAPPSEREAWRYLPSGEWFFMESEDCVHRFSVMERTSSGCVSICSTSWSHERARRDMQSIAELHNRQARAAVPQAAARLEAFQELRDWAVTQLDMVHWQGQKAAVKDIVMRLINKAEVWAAAVPAPGTDKFPDIKAPHGSVEYLREMATAHAAHYDHAALSEGTLNAIVNSALALTEEEKRKAWGFAATNTNIAVAGATAPPKEAE